MDKTQFIKSTIPRMAQYTFPYLTSVVGVLDAQTGRHLGSGLRCILNGRRAMVTAVHVIEAAIGEAGFALSVGYAMSPFLVSGKIRFDPVADLAIYYLPDAYPSSREGVAFWPEERIERSVDHLATDYLFVHGFPAARSRFLSLANGIASKSLPYGVMQRLDDVPADLQEFQFALDFDPAHMHIGVGEPLVDPQGLSGSPVWRVGISGGTAAEWSPERSAIVGFLTQWRPVEKILVASQASRLFSSRTN
jgi:hypothetical protein